MTPPPPPYIYDGDGNLVKKTLGTANTSYVGNYFEWTGGTSTMVKYYYHGGKRVAMRVGASTWYFLLTDHLTSTSITATSAGSKSAELRYKAWGETRYTSGTTPTTYRFTGQREESIIGLYFYNARWYDAALGRFVQADTIVPEPGNPQALNRYAYVTNNPVRYTDPSGHRVDPSGVGARDKNESPPNLPVIPMPVPTPLRVIPTATPAPTVRPESTPRATTPWRTSTPMPLVVAGPDGPVQVGVWKPLPPSEPAHSAIGWRLDVSLQALGGIDFNADLMLNLGSGQIDLLLGSGTAGGLNAGGSWTTGPVIAWDCPNNEVLEGADLFYKGADVPIAFLGLNVEVEMATSREGRGPTTLYLGGSPLGMPGGIQAGVQTGISVNVLRVRVLDLW